MTDHAAPIRDLKGRHVAALEAAGLTVLPGTWGYDPDVGADVVHVVVSAGEEAMTAHVDQPAADAAFDEIMRGDRAATEAEAEADLRRRLADGGSILGD